MSKKKPRTLSIVTVIYNDLAGLKTTCQSLSTQTMTEFEWIVIDGGSTDGSVEFIQSQPQLVSAWVSEADNGIFDAMNKGIRLATGDWITFLNAGDSYTSETALERIFSRDLSAIHFVYTDMFLLSESGKPVRKIPAEPLTRCSISKGMIACHQGMFVRRVHCPFYKEELRYQGDLNWTMDILQALDPDALLHVPEALVYFSSGGFSSQCLFKQLQVHLSLIYARYGVLMIVLRLPRLCRRYGGKWVRRLLGIETFRFWIR